MVFEPQCFLNLQRNCIPNHIWTIIYTTAQYRIALFFPVFFSFFFRRPLVDFIPLVICIRHTSVISHVRAIQKERAAM